MAEPADELAELREDVDRRTQRFEAAAQAASVVTASDPSGTVQVRLSTSGSPQDVVVREGWRAHVPAAGLGAAVLEAFTAAALERARVWGESTARAADAEEPRTRPAAPAHLTAPGGLRELLAARGASPDARRAMSELAATLREINRGLDATFEVAQGRARAEHTGRSGRHVEAVVDGTGALLRVEADVAWLERAPASTVSSELTVAVAAAVAQAAAAAPANVFVGTPLADVSRILTDPQALAERLGL